MFVSNAELGGAAGQPDDIAAERRQQVDLFVGVILSGPHAHILLRLGAHIAVAEGVDRRAGGVVIGRIGICIDRTHDRSARRHGVDRIVVFRVIDLPAPLRAFDAGVAARKGPVETAPSGREITFYAQNPAIGVGRVGLRVRRGEIEEILRQEDRSPLRKAGIGGREGLPRTVGQERVGGGEGDRARIGAGVQNGPALALGNLLPLSAGIERLRLDGHRIRQVVAGDGIRRQTFDPGPQADQIAIAEPVAAAGEGNADILARVECLQAAVRRELQRNSVGLGQEPGKRSGRVEQHAIGIEFPEPRIEQFAHRGDAIGRTGVVRIGNGEARQIGQRAILEPQDGGS
ncbi:hypothetical protein TMRO357_01461 [Alteriqipengyuania sp. 357]